MYTLLIPTGLSNYVISTCSALIFNIFTAYVDGIVRGTTIASLPSLIASSGNNSNWWTSVLLSGIVVSSGGWLILGFGLHESEWGLGRPSILNGGLLDTLDLWGGMLTGLVYAGLTRSHPEVGWLSDTFATVLPKDMRIDTNGVDGKGSIVTSAIGRAISVLLLGSLLFARVVTNAVLGYRKTSGAKAKKPRRSVTPVANKGDLGEKNTEEVVKLPTKFERKGATPRKSPKPKKA